MSSENIFESWITLRFKDKSYELIYERNRILRLKKFNIILSAIMFILSLGLTIAFLINLDFMFSNFTYKYVALVQFVSNVLITVNLILCTIANPRIQSWLTYINYTYILFVFGSYRYFFIWILQADIFIYGFLFALEILFRKTWYIMGLIDFVPGVYLQIATIVITYSTYSAVASVPFLFRFGIYAGILIITNGITYFYIREQKRSFYYYHAMKNKYEWFKNVIDNMNSGFISIKNSKVHYYNYTTIKLLKNDLMELTTDTDSFELSLDNIFININSDTFDITSYDDVTRVLLGNYPIVGDNFIFLGTKTITNSPTTDINLEVYGRCYSSTHSAINKFEFIFNDTTRSKLIEEKNAEFKYKNLFLSKVAHEFKNPLLCICELVDQISEKIDKVSEVKDILKQIKSMSNYLIILIKDLDYFSQYNTGMIKTVEMDYVNLDDLVQFCEDILIVLIKKLNKEDNVRVELYKCNKLPKSIYSDEIKLKQILVNLLSNAIKYTQSGFIKLSLILIEGNIMFKVDDTGKGISEQQKDKLFIPFSNEFDKLNKFSSGLGLSIVNGLTKRLGSKIEFYTEVEKGSSFWFEIPIGDNVRYTDESFRSVRSDITTKGIHFCQQNFRQVMEDISTNRLIETEHKQNNLIIIVVDDEVITRQSTIRLLSKYLKSYNPTIVEASDGIDCLYKFMLLYKEGKRIDFILSDESMELMNGSTCAEVLNNLYENRNFSAIPFFIVSAFESLYFGKVIGVSSIYSKPLRKQNIEEIIKSVS
jgi:signal transduction histidine kinase